MEIFKTVDPDNHVTLAISGIINTDTAHDLNRELQALNYESLDLTLDFADTEYITSSGLRVLLVARKKLTENTMRLVHVNNAVMDVLKTTGFDSLIPVDNGTDSGVPNENFRLSISALLNKRLEERPDDTAYIYRGKAATWRDVETASQIIADDLALNNVKKGSHVGLCGPNSINWIFTFFAIQKLGAIAVLINPALKPAEIDTVAEISDLTHLCYAETPGKTLFADYKSAFLLGGPGRFVYDISDSADFTERFDEYGAIAEKYREDHYADDASVIIFSSGSTGRPKAILSSSYNLLSSIEPLIREMRINREDINLAFLPLFHIFGFATGISAGLLTGYCSVIPEGKSPVTMIRAIEEYRCTIFNTVPTMILTMIQLPGFTPEKLSSLRLSVLGGSATTEEQMKKLRQLMPYNHFGNIYGMSENAAVSLTGYEDTVEHLTQTVGRPVPGLELEIRDISTNQPLGPGLQGEVFIRSDTMAVCYYKLPLENQPVDDEGWLSTGDLGLIDEDGCLRLVGRTKDLIISGGENISPGEIAEAISRLPEIADVKVLGIPHEIRGEVPAAAVILKPDAVWDEGKVREALAEKLAKYKLPVSYTVVKNFPLLGSGKVDTITLKEMIRKSAGK